MQEGTGGVLLVSGAAGGIGQAVMRLWQDRGGLAVGLDLDGSERIVPCDVSDDGQVAAAVSDVVERHGRLDAVFHAAGLLGPAATVVDLSPADWRVILDVHLTGGYLLARHAAPVMARLGGGALVFTGSIVGDGGSPLYPAYAAAKAGLVNLAASVAAAFGRNGVRANVVSPGSVAGTGLVARSRGFGPTLEEVATLAATIPTGRAATPADVAEAVCFLASPAARHITGTVLVVDGGERLPRKLTSVKRPAD